MSITEKERLKLKIADIWQLINDWVGDNFIILRHIAKKITLIH